MDSHGIVELYCRAPDFDISKTMYQVEHIMGARGTEYTAPSCATMRTYGFCIKKDTICDNVNHPLNFYAIKKKRLEQKDERKVPVT
jgi:DNA primase large subunit